jgi:uncharacterized protein YcaQ
VWLGLDHSFGFGQPLIFETMIHSLTLYPHNFFGRLHLGPEWDDYQERYSTETEAVAGHEQLVRTLLRAQHELGRMGKEIVLSRSPVVTHPSAGS